MRYMHTRVIVFMLLVWLGGLQGGLSAYAEARVPTATIIALQGEALIFFQGGSPIPASLDTVLREGDTIRTHAEATVVFQLSDGTELTVAENTHLNIAELSEDPRTGARKSRLNLLWGKIRSLVSAGHQVEGASYTIQTPNTFADIQFSHPDSEVLYDPGTSTTTVIPHKFDVVVTNRVTNDTVLIPEGFIGIIQDRDIKKLARTIPFATGSKEIDTIATFRLHSLAKILREFPDQAIILEGHTDNVGSEKINQKLGLERAEIVKTYLVQQYGFDPARIKIYSYGADQPVAPNDTEAGRARNRRVTISRDL